MNYDWARDGRKRAGLALVVALIAHSAMGGVVAKSPVPVVIPMPEPDRTEVRTFELDVRRKKPPPPKVEVEVVKPPPPKVEPIPEPKVAEPAPEPKTVAAAPKAAPRRAKPKADQKPSSKPNTAPRTLRVTNLGGTGGVKAYEGTSDSFGSPEEKATPENDGPDTRPSGDGPTGSTGQAPSGDGGAEPAPAGTKVTAPKVKVRVIGDYPAGAPRTGRPVSLTLKLDIDASGTVTRARVLSKPPIAGDFFDKEAIRVAKATRFEPAMRDGAQIPFSIRYVVKFEP